MTSSEERAYRPIRDYALIGGAHTAALVANDGSIDWCCCPDFDSPAVFCRLLDASKGGWFRVGPTGRYATERSYVGPTNVLATTMARPPHLHVMDALWAGEGRGPIGNTPAWVGCVLASTDPVELDVTTARLLGFPDAQAISMTYTREAVSRGLGTADLTHVEVLGESLDAVRTPICQNPVDLSFSYLAPIHVIVGEGVSLPGTIGHFKSVADVWHKDHIWDLICLYRGGTPTIMIGRAEDPDFEQHLAEGPYVTIDDVVDDRYKRHPSVQHIPGHPVCDQMYRELIRAFGVKLLGTTAMELMKVFTNLRSELKY
jgi:hypothetical protein